MRTYDITEPLAPGMPTWPGEPGPRLRTIKAIGVEGEPARVSVLEIGTHCGTHIDAPCHLLQDAGGVETLPLDALVGPCQVVAIGGTSPIEPEQLKSVVTSGVRRVLLKTRRTASLGDQLTSGQFSALSPAAAHWLADAGLRLVGIDTPSVDPFDADPLDAHLILLRAGTVILEGIDLRAVPCGAYDLTALPLRLVGADGAPARVVLRSRPHPSCDS